MNRRRRREIRDLVQFIDAHGGLGGFDRDRWPRPGVVYGEMREMPADKSGAPESTDEPGSASTARDGRSRSPSRRNASRRSPQ